MNFLSILLKGIMKKKLSVIFPLFFLVISFIFISLGCATIESLFEPILDPPGLADDEPSRGLFFKVEGGENDLYLFGSVHMGSEDMYPLHDDIDEVFGQSDVLGMELDPEEMVDSEEMLMQKGTFDDDRVMTDLVSDETFEEVVSIMELFGLSREEVEQFKPWFAGVMLEPLPELRAGYSPELGIENYFMERANDDMEILGLETPSDQIEVFERLSDESQVVYLEGVLQVIDSGVVPLDNTISFWKEGDVEFFAELRRENIEGAETESLREFQIALLDERDEQMSLEIERLLEDDTGRTYFIVVGALHLAGENSIPDFLEESGYEILEMY